MKISSDEYPIPQISTYQVSVMPGKKHNQQLNRRLHDKLTLKNERNNLLLFDLIFAILTIYLPGTALSITSDNDSPANVYTVGGGQLNVID